MVKSVLLDNHLHRIVKEAAKLSKQKIGYFVEAAILETVEKVFKQHGVTLKYVERFPKMYDKDLQEEDGEQQVQQEKEDVPVQNVQQDDIEPDKGCSDETEQQQVREMWPNPEYSPASQNPL